MGTVWDSKQDIGDPHCFTINNFNKERHIKTVEEQMSDYRLNGCNGGRIHCIWGVEERWLARVWQGGWARKWEKSTSSENVNSNKNSQRKWEEKVRGYSKEREKQWGIFCMVHEFYYLFDDPDNNKNWEITGKYHWALNFSPFQQCH